MNDIQNQPAVFNRLCDQLRREVPTFSALFQVIQSLPESAVFITGGVVRDVFLQQDRGIKDIDIFITAEAFGEIQDFFLGNGRLERNQFGSYRWFGQADENVYYDIIVIENFYNGLWQCRNITDALNQFDVTVNAIAFDLKSGRLFDPENGLLDISQKVLRAVRFDYPELMVSADIPVSRNTVLWFRYLHYSNILNLTIDGLTAGWISENSFRLAEQDLFTQYFFEPHLADV